MTTPSTIDKLAADSIALQRRSYGAPQQTHADARAGFEILEKARIERDAKATASTPLPHGQFSGRKALLSRIEALENELAAAKASKAPVPAVARRVETVTRTTAKALSGERRLATAESFGAPRRTMTREQFGMMTPADKTSFSKGGGKLADDTASATTTADAVAKQPLQMTREEFGKLSPADRSRFSTNGGRLI